MLHLRTSSSPSDGWGYHRRRDPLADRGRRGGGMFLFDIEGILGIFLLGLWIYCIFDAISTDASMVRNLPKNFWIILVIILPDVGSIAWLVLGRPERAGWRPGDTTYRKPFSTRFVVRGPED